MRVGFLISGSLDSVTGGYIYDRQLVDHLRGAGHQVEVFHIPGRTYLERWLNSPRLLLSREFTRLSPDVLLQDELDHPALILLNRRLKGRKPFRIVSIVHHLRSSEFRPPWQNQGYGWVEKNYLQSVDGFVFNSRSTQQAVERLVGKVQKSIMAFPCGNRLSERITEAQIEKRAKGRGPLRILFLGNLIRRKALHVLLAALARLPRDGYFLTIVGDLFMDRPYVREVQNQIREAALGNSLVFLGSVSDSELASKLAGNHILAVPSIYEGFGIAYLEGMGFGLPAIATTAGGASEIITHGQDGYLIEPGDSAALAQYLREVGDDRERLAVMSLNALRRFNSHPTWQATGAKILNFLQSV